MRKALNRMITVGAVAGALVGLAAVPASAHDYPESICSPTHCYGRAIVTLSHTKITICDDVGDGVGVSVEYWVEKPNGDEYYGKISDGNGSADPCNSWTATGGSHIARFRGFSADGKGSTGWVYA